MERNRFNIIGIFGTCLLAFVFMLTGVTTPGWWIVYQEDIDYWLDPSFHEGYRTSYYYGFNPFYIVSKECDITPDKTVCKEAEMEIKPVDQLHSDLWPGRVFGIITMVFMVISITLTAVLACNDYRGKIPCLLATFGWFISAITLILAITVQPKSSKGIEYYFSTEYMKFPYSRLLFGFSAFFCVIIGAYFSVVIYKKNGPKMGVGSTKSRDLAPKQQRSSQQKTPVQPVLGYPLVTSNSQLTTPVVGQVSMPPSNQVNQSMNITTSHEIVMANRQPLNTGKLIPYSCLNTSDVGGQISSVFGTNVFYSYPAQPSNQPTTLILTSQPTASYIH